MAEQIHPAFNAADEPIDTRALVHHLGSAGELTTLSPSACPHHLARIHSLPELRDFLKWYQQEVLGPKELHQVYQAATFASKGFIRELLALDTALAKEPSLPDFQLASRHVGKRQLNKMRPQRDLRVVQKYRDAVNDGKAYGWHTLVYGVVLNTYSLPLRQGMLHYARQTLGGFIQSAARTLDLREDVCYELESEATVSLPTLIEATVQANGGGIQLLS